MSDRRGTTGQPDVTNQPSEEFSAAELGLDAPETYRDIVEEYSRKAEGFAAEGDRVKVARARLAVAFALEKLGDWAQAAPIAFEAREGLRNEGERHWQAEANHSIGVWRFHNTDGPAPVEDFRRAIDIRAEDGEWMPAAQSAHNLALVALIDGQVELAREEYARATHFLRVAIDGDNPEASIKADRQQGFVLSHLAFLTSRHDAPDAAVAATAAYFDHVERTGAHREPVYAFIAPAITLRRHPGYRSAVLDELGARLGIASTALAWGERAVTEAHTAMVSDADTGTGRHAYLGAEILACTELAEVLGELSRHDDATVYRDRAVRLATARGWHGEAARARRVVSGHAVITE